MADATAPIITKEVLTLPSIGINPQFITFNNVTMESEKYICIRETSPQNSVVIVDMSLPMQPLRRPITADSALMNPNTRILAFKGSVAQLAGNTQDHLQIFNIETKTKVKSHQMPEQVVFWKWITPKLLGLVTQTSVYHWSIEGNSPPAKTFERTGNLANHQIIDYRCDPAEKWLVLIGIAPGSPERPQLVKGSMQLFSMDQQRSQALEAHVAAYATFEVPANKNLSTLLVFATKSLNAGQVTSKLHIIELGAQPGKPGFTKKQADLFYPPDFNDDFPVSMQVPYKRCSQCGSYRKNSIHIVYAGKVLNSWLQNLPVQAGLVPPLLEYYGTLLTKGKLNAFESLELSRIVVNQNKKKFIEYWLAEGKLECSEELGDLVKTVDNDLAVKIYIRARVNPKVVAAFAERKEFDKVLVYSKMVGYTPDYLFLLQAILRTDPQVAVNFALMMSQMEGGSPIDYNTITDHFLQSNLIREATTFLLDVLKPNLPEHGYLQTKVLEINLVTFPNVADVILANGMFSHYDRSRIAQLCEKAGLYLQALKHYTDLSDVKRVIVNTHAIEPQALIEFFGTLSREWALECMKDLLLVNLRGNLQIIVQTAKEYCEQLGVDACIKLFEQFKSYEGLYCFLGSYLSSSEDPDIHFKYIESAAKTGQLKEVERVTRESNFYDPEKTLNFLMEAKLPDARPLINICDRFGFVPDLTHYLYTSNMLRCIEGYVQKINHQDMSTARLCLQESED